MKRIWVIIILFNYFSYGQVTNVSNFQFPSNATTDSIKAVINEMLDAISSHDSTRATKLVIRGGHVIRISVRRLGLEFPSLNHRITDE